jgi:LuxR family maltose regulon positive regulatory protein
LDTRALIDAMAGLALSQQLRHEADAASETVDRLWSLAMETNDPVHVILAESNRIRLALLRGDLTQEAIAWARSFSQAPDPAALFMWLEIPQLTQARVWIAEGVGESLKKATDLLHGIRQLAKTNRFTNQVIEVAVLQSVTHDKQGDTEEALTILDEVVALAEPLGWVRPFVESGPAMARLLNRLAARKKRLKHIERLLFAFKKCEGGVPQPVSHPPERPMPHAPPQQLVEPLSNRELEVLEMLARRLQNKEIAEKLFISPTTVKTHLRNIYQKLSVGNRREAVVQAGALGILPQTD